jgi:hypothetical protein
VSGVTVKLCPLFAHCLSPWSLLNHSTGSRLGFPLAQRRKSPALGERGRTQHLQGHVGRRGIRAKTSAAKLIHKAVIGSIHRLAGCGSVGGRSDPYTGLGPGPLPNNFGRL